MATISENLITLQSIKSDIRSAIEAKGGTVTDAFGGYAKAITDLPGGGDDKTLNSILMRTISGTYSNSLITTIGSSALAGCTHLTELYLPNVSIINYGTFLYCTRLNYISLPKCTFVSFYAFGFNYSLTSISLPVTSRLQSRAFFSCKLLQSVYLLSDSVVTFISVGGIDPFTLCNNRLSVYVPSSLYDGYMSAYGSWICSLSGQNRYYSEFITPYTEE